MATSLTNNMEIALVNTGTNPGTIQLPNTQTIPYRLVTIKDVNGSLQKNTLTIQTNGIDLFEDGSTTLYFSTPGAFYTFYANASSQRWVLVSGNNFRAQAISSLTVNAINGNPYTFISPTNLVSTPLLTSSLQSTVRGLGTAGYLSSVSLSNLVSTSLLESSLQSTVRGLGTIGYLSSVSLSNLVSTSLLESSLQSTVRGLGNRYLSTLPLFISAAGIFTSSLVTSTISALTIATTGLIAQSTMISSLYVSSVTGVKGYISSFQVDEIQFGDGTGWVDFGPLRANYISSLQENTGSLYATTVYVGGTSTLSQIRYFGLVGNYNGTYLAEVSTGGAWGAQEFLIFRGSSTNDRIRLQTTGDIRFEPQVSSREFSTATALAVPTMIMQSNLVGIATASPATTLDVAGTIRGQVVSTQQLLISSINSIRFTDMVSTATLQSSLQSTVAGLGTIGYISSVAGVNLNNLVSTPLLESSLQSTVRGLGTTGYLSSLINIVSSPFLASNLQSTITGLGTAGYLSSLINLVSTPYLDTSLQSTVRGLGTTGYLSSLINVVSTPFLASNLQSTVAGLGTTGYLSSLINLVSTPFLNTTLQSTVTGLGTVGYLSSISLSNLVSTPYLDTSLQSTVRGLGTTGYLSSLINIVSTPYLDTSLQSTVRGLGTTGYLSSLINIVSTPYLDTSLQSTVRGLGTTGYLSSLINIVSTPFLASNLQSTVAGLGTIGYLSSVSLSNLVSTSLLESSLQSTVRGLGTIGYLSSVSLSNLVSTSLLESSLQSTVRGLGTAGYLSSVTGVSLSNLVSTPLLESSLQSTVRGLGTLGYISSLTLASSLQSTVRGLGTVGYISSAQLLSTTAAYRNTFTTNSSVTSSLTASSMYSVQGYISSLITDSLTIGDGNGWVDIGALRGVVVSTQQINTGTMYGGTVFVGTTSTLNQVRYFGLVGNYNGTYLAEVSTGGAWGAQEFLIFRGSSTNDRIRLQTTGDIRFEPQVASREFSTATALATPTMIMQSNLVGIATASPATTLDVAGTIRGQVVSTQQLLLSSINGLRFTDMISTATLQTSLQSTVAGLGTTGYLSSLINIVSTPFLNNSLQSTVEGLGTAFYISAPTFLSTLEGLSYNFTTSSLTVSSITFGTDYGFLSLGDIQTDVLSSLRIYTSTIQVDGSINLYDKQLTNYGNVTLSNNNLYINGSVVGGGGGGGGGGPINYVSAFTVSTSYLNVSSISSYYIECYGTIGSAFFNPGPDILAITSFTDAIISASNLSINPTNDLILYNTTSTIVSTNSFYLTGTSDPFIDGQLTAKNIFCYNTVSTHTLSVYGSNTLVVDGTSIFKSNVTVDALMTSRKKFVPSTLGSDDVNLAVQDIDKTFVLNVSYHNNIYLPSAGSCGNGWSAVINNQFTSFGTLTIYYDGSNVLVATQPAGTTITCITDGSTWYAY